MYEWDVFISHNRQQKAWVRRMVEQLRSLGLKVFFDDDSIPLGIDFMEAIEDGITSSRYVLLIMSSASLSSRWVAMEIGLTIHEDTETARNSLIPVLIEPIPMENIRPSIRRLRWIDLTTNRRREEYHYLLQTLGINKEKLPDPPVLESKLQSVPILSAMGTKGGVGKSAIILAAAELIAMTGHNVLILDADIQDYGMTKYLGGRTRSRPHVQTILAYCSDLKEQIHDRPHRNIGVWDVTPEYLQDERFGYVHLVPARLDGDGRSSYEVIADIPPSIRNEAVLKMLQEIIQHHIQSENNYSAVLIDCGAQNNPLVSAGVVLADYPLITSDPHIGSNRKISECESMHQERYSDRHFNSMHILVNQATPETPGIWAGIPDVSFIKEDPKFRRNVARGKIDFEGVGLNNFYLDVLTALKRTFSASHQRLLPDEAEVWLRPYLESIRDFPETLLKLKRYRLLTPITLTWILAAILLLAPLLYYFYGVPVRVEEVIDRPESMSIEEFQAKLDGLVIPEELQDKVKRAQFTGSSGDPQSKIFKVVLEAPLSGKEFIRLSQTAVSFEPYSNSVTAAHQRLQTKMQNKLTLLIAGVVVVIFAVVYRFTVHHTLQRHKRFLCALIEARDQDRVQQSHQSRENLKCFLDVLRTDNPDKPQLYWLREIYDRWAGAWDHSI